MPRHYVIVGATSAIALGCARLWAARGAAQFTLVGRDEARLARTAADLRARAPGLVVNLHVADFHSPAGIADFARATSAVSSIMSATSW